MRAFISGQAGIAVLIDGEEYSSIEVHSAESVPRTANDLAYLVGDAVDLVEIEGVSKDDAARKLDVAWRKDRGLQLALIAIDGEAARENRLRSARCLIDLLIDPQIIDFVRNRLYAAPLPSTADFRGALTLAGSAGSAKFASILRQLNADQELIRRNRLAWDAIRADMFGGPVEKERFGFIAVESGMFRCLAQGNSSDALSAFSRFGRDHRVDVKWDVRGLVKRWQRISELVAKDSLAQVPLTAGPASRHGESASQPTRVWGASHLSRAADAVVSGHRWWVLAACLLVAALIPLSIYLTPVSAKNAIALTPPGTGGIKATGSLFRSEVHFGGQGAEARNFFDQAERALSQGDFVKAARLYEMSMGAVDTLAAQLNLGIAIYNTSDLPKAASIFSAGLKTARERHAEVLESAFLNNLGNVYREQGLPVQANQMYEEANEIDIRSGNALGVATATYNRGLLFEIRGRYLEALFQFDIARTGYQKRGDKSGEADALVGRAGVFRILQRAADASADLRAAASLYEQIPGALAEANYHSTMALYQGYDNPSDTASMERAFEEYKRAYAIYERIGYRQGQTITLCGLGNGYNEKANRAEAMAAYLSSLRIAEEIGSPFREAIALENVGRLSITLGEYAEGLESLRRAADLANRIGAKGLEANSLQVIGSGYAKSRNEAQALVYFDKAVKAAEESGDRFLLIATLEPIADGYVRLHDVDRGRESLLKLRDLYAAVGSDKKSAAVQRKIEELPK